MLYQCNELACSRHKTLNIFCFINYWWLLLKPTTYVTKVNRLHHCYTLPHTLRCVDHILNSRSFFIHFFALNHSWSICTSDAILQQYMVYYGAYKPIKVTESLCIYLVYSHVRQKYIICIPLCTKNLFSYPHWRQLTTVT